MMKQSLFPNSFANGNLTVRAVLANGAPAIPEWFKINFREQPPTPENIFSFFHAHKLSKLINKYWNGENEEWEFPVELIEVEGTTADEIISFQKEVTDHIKKIQQYWEDKKLWDYEYAKAMFFQWRSFYADQLIVELNKD